MRNRHPKRDARSSSAKYHLEEGTCLDTKFPLVSSIFLPLLSVYRDFARHSRGGKRESEVRIRDVDVRRRCGRRGWMANVEGIYRSRLKWASEETPIALVTRSAREESVHPIKVDRWPRSSFRQAGSLFLPPFLFPLSSSSLIPREWLNEEHGSKQRAAESSNENS